MARGFRIGYPRAVRVFGDPGTYAITGQDAGVNKGFTLTSAQGAYTVSGQSVGPILFWDSSTGAVGYRFYWGTSSGSYTQSQDDTGTALHEALSLLNLLPDTNYYVVVRAYNASGESGNSNELHIFNGAVI